MASSFKNTIVGHDPHDDVDDNTRQYVESMETGNGKEEVGKVGRSHRSVDVGERVATPPGAFMMREAKELSRGEKKQVNEFLKKSDRIDRIANELLGLKKL